MPAFKDPSFQQRQQSAAKAKGDALATLKAKPPVDEAVLAERAAKRLARESAEVEKRAAVRAAREAEAEAKREAARVAAEEIAAATEAAAAAALAARPKLPTAAELKAARDARYAARKSRQNGR